MRACEQARKKQGSESEWGREGGVTHCTAHSLEQQGTGTSRARATASESRKLTVSIAVIAVLLILVSLKVLVILIVVVHVKVLFIRVHFRHGVQHHHGVAKHMHGALA